MSDIREHLNTSYEEYAKYLQNKYGMPKQAYYTPKEGALVRNKISRTKEGLQCHHIREDIATGLSVPDKASNQDMSYQSPENLCYCNLLEHFLLHIKIAEMDRNDKSDMDLCNAGVNWLALIINTTLANPSKSWYSKKGFECIKKDFENSDVDYSDTGVNYNVNSLITEHEDDYVLLVNRYCTSAIVRLKLDKTNEELGEQLCKYFCRDTEGGVYRVVELIRNAAKDTKLFSWNVGAYASLEKAFADGNRTALIDICTGGGKTTSAIEYLRVHNCRGLVLAPSGIIKSGWEKAKKDGANLDVTTYQTFMNRYRDVDYSQYGVIIADEAHHIEAERWGEGLAYVLENTSLPIIGLTATPSPAQEDGTDKFFKGAICEGLDLAKGIKEGHIHPFGYVKSIYKVEDVYNIFGKYGVTTKQLVGNFNLDLNKEPAEKVLRDNMPSGKRKIICFVQCKEDFNYAEETLKRYNPNLALYHIYSGKTTEEDIRDGYTNSEAKEIFAETADKDICLVNVNMAAEGAHYKNINTLVVFRRTRSSTLFMQQLGRIVVTTKNEDPNGIVFDFTNNAETLIHAKDVNVAERKTVRVLRELMAELKRMKEEREGKEIIYRDYTEDCVAVLSAIDASQNVETFSRVFSNALAAQTESGDLSEIFDATLYFGDSKKDKGKKTKVSKRKSSIASETVEEINSENRDNTNSENASETQTPVSADIKVNAAKALKETVKWAYMCKAISFEDTAKHNLIVNKENMFNSICLKNGFSDPEAVKRAIQKSTISCVILILNAEMEK